MPHWRIRLARAPAFAAALLGSAAALGQESTALDRFDPAPAGDAFFAVPSAAVPGRLRPGAAVTVTYADRPLTLRSTVAGSGELTWVSRQVLLHALTSVELAQRVKLDLDMPLMLDQGGSSGALGEREVRAPSGAGAGDLRIGARAVLLPQQGVYPAAGLRLSAWLPTGEDGAFSGAPSVRFAPALVIGADHGRWLWSATLGGRFQAASEESLTGSETFGGAAAAIRVGALQVGPELLISGAAGGPSAALVRSGVSAEALLGGRYALGPVTIGAGGGAGFGRAPGTPAFRLFASLGIAADLVDDPSRRRGAGGAGRGGAPTAPRPLAPPPAPPPPESDVDGVPSAIDVIGVSPADTRRTVRIEGTQIILLQQVNFATGKAEILSESFDLLRQVAEVMQEHPEIARVAVDGHTDSRGAARTNLDLSRRRALSVVRWLTEQGVDARRLEARGFGPRRPIADNATQEGRARNRRVEFQILRRTPEGEAGWRDGPIED